jgi:hypothetical protein
LLVKPPGLEVTVYPVIDEPPLLADVVNVIVARAVPAIAIPIVGAPGIVEGGALVVNVISFP